MNFRLNKMGFLVAASIASLLAACSEHNHAGDDHHSHDAPAAQLESKASPDNQDNHGDAHKNEDKSGDTDKPAIRSAASHIHGGAELALALDGKIVSVEFETPLYNLLGFEHTPDTDAQRSQVEKAEMQLLKGADLFAFNAGAKCKISSQNQSIHLFPETSEHEDEHDEDHHDEEGHDEEDHHEDDHDSGHKDVFLRYGFTCQTPEKLANVTVNLFEFFDDLSDIDVTYLGSSTQKQTGLTRNNIKMDLKP
jgi:hypothetical protein